MSKRTTAICQAESCGKAHDRTIDGVLRPDPARLMGDSAYGSAETLGRLVHEHGIELDVKVFESPHARCTFSRDDFTDDHARDLYLCPGGRS